MRIAADKNIPYIETALTGMGTLYRYDSRNRKEMLQAIQDANILLCRSTLNVNAELLKDSKVRFVATATSGTDHIDIQGLQALGIVVASAAGSNARSVADWVTAVLFSLRKKTLLTFEDSSVGIVGVGHVGIQVYSVAKTLGMHIVLNDPPRQERGERPVQGENIAFSSLEEALGCTILTMHVPLERSGDFATYQMMNMKQFSLLHNESIFINAARGNVMHPGAVLQYAGRGNTVALDVFPNEPNIESSFIRHSRIATAHIAGHSSDAKLRGTQMVYDALCEWLGRPLRWRYETHLPDMQPLSGRLKNTDNPLDEVEDVIRQVYDVVNDDNALRGICEINPEQRGAYFEKLRAEYPLRREFGSARVKAEGLSREAVDILGELGFGIVR